MLLDGFSSRAFTLTMSSDWRPAEVVFGESVGAECVDGWPSKRNVSATWLNSDTASGVAVVDIEEMLEDEGS